VQQKQSIEKYNKSRILGPSRFLLRVSSPGGRNKTQRIVMSDEPTFLF
jgi:hypothetical protein